MLEKDYSGRLKKLIEASTWEVNLPESLAEFFAVSGEVTSTFADDQRGNQRIRIRTRGILWPEVTLPFCPRNPVTAGIYTQDLSRSGAGFLSSFELYPEEEVRIVLPTFWIRVKISRVRRLGEKCFETGAVLLKKHPPSPNAFCGI